MDEAKLDQALTLPLARLPARAESPRLLRFEPRAIDDYEPRMVDEKYVLVVGGGQSYYRPFSKFGAYSSHHSLFDRQPERIALVLFTGGADICPSLYGESEGKRTYTVRKRDVMEVAAFRRALRKGIPCVGVCRGAQFLCVMAGGKLVQHVTHHSEYHQMMLNTGDNLYVSSTHHQMMLPPPGAELIGWAFPPRSTCYLGGDDCEMETPKHEAEICYFPNINALGMQYHPEMMQELSSGYRLVERLMTKYLLKPKEEPKHDQEVEAVGQPCSDRT